MPRNVGWYCDPAPARATSVSCSTTSSPARTTPGLCRLRNRPGSRGTTPTRLVPTWSSSSQRRRASRSTTPAACSPRRSDRRLDRFEPGVDLICRSETTPGRVAVFVWRCSGPRWRSYTRATRVATSELVLRVRRVRRVRSPSVASPPVEHHNRATARRASTRLVPRRDQSITTAACSAAGSTHGHHRDVDIDRRRAFWRRPGRASADKRPARLTMVSGGGAESADPSIGTELCRPALHLSSRRCRPNGINHPPGKPLRHEGATRS